MALGVWRRRLLGISLGMLSVYALRAAPTDSLRGTDSLARLSTLERLFGKGGVKFKLRGTATLGGLMRNRRVEHPLLQPHNRQGLNFEFEQQINASLNASLGERLRLSMGYNTSATLEQDARSIKLTYEGRQGDLLRLVEVGNLSFRPANSLIQYGSALFGIRTRLEHGPLRLDLIASQQKSQRQTIHLSQGNQMQRFTLSSAEYDQRRHFFLSDFFRSQYDQALSTLPRLRSEVQIRRLEVWVTNRNGSYDGARNLLAFADLGEHQRIHNPQISPKGQSITDNEANTLYEQLRALAPESGQLSPAQLPGGFVSGLEYELMTSARQLAPSEYFLNSTLGFISLKRPLAVDEVLAVAYEYTYRGQTYRVGILSPDGAPTGTLIAKLLHGSNPTPRSPHWHYMMRNVYSIGHGQIDPRSLELHLLYRTGQSARLSPQLPEEGLDKRPLLQLLGLDRNSSDGAGRADGRLDYYEGITFHSAWGLLYLPNLEPFGSSLEQTLGGKTLADKYAYPELYNSSPREIAEHRERDRFVLSGQYRGSSSSSTQELHLGQSLRAGSVTVRHAGRELTEGIDYIVDYLSGQVEVLNAQVLASNEAIEVSLDKERRTTAMRRTILGADLVYAPTQALQLGASVMHLSELSEESLPTLGSEALSNTLWGARLQYQSDAPWLQRALNWLPIAQQTAPASIAFTAEFAHLHAGTISREQSEGYIDDFDHTMSPIELIHPAPWRLASRPVDLRATERTTPSEVGAGDQRAHLSWYRIDPLLTRQYNRLTPAYIQRNPSLVSHHYVRDVELRELYPLQASELAVASYLPTLNLSYYPYERGPYNLETDRMQTNGLLAAPEQSWAGIMRRIEQADFEQAGIEYLEFWLMDPFAYQPNSRGGRLSIHIGEISEDIIPDGQLSYEQGLDAEAGSYSPWGKVPTGAILSRSFDQDPSIRQRQDVGLNGLSSALELTHPTYLSYLEGLRSRVSSLKLREWEGQRYSPLRDPAGDNFIHYRDPEYDRLETPILERYKYYNGTEGNSPAVSSAEASSTLAGQADPDSEDINLDNSLSLSNRYYAYHIELTPERMQAGEGFIVGKRRAEVVLRNGETSHIDWYLYRIPIRAYTEAIGGVQGFRSMRVIRLVLSQFSQRQDLRFGSLRLVRGAWQVYERPLSESVPTTTSRLSLSSVGLESEADRTPINYIPPPGREHLQRLSIAGTHIDDEQALALRVETLAPGESRAIHRSIQYDMRPYEYLELRTHAERLAHLAAPETDALELFVRLGSDMQSNYYEYSLPLRLTPERQYSLHSQSDRLAVWPEENALRISLEALTRLKALRSVQSEVSPEYSMADPNHTGAIMRVQGTPSLGSVQTLMIGLRNASTNEVSAEVWLNDLRLSGRSDKGGWGANARLSLGLSDLGKTTLGARFASAGFGALEQGLHERQQEAMRHLSLSTTLDLGKLFPAQTQLSIPLQYALSSEQTTPKYNPTQTDLLLDATLEAQASQGGRDSTLLVSTRIRTTQSLSITGARLNLRSKQPMPYDPANLSLTYIYNTSLFHSPELERQQQRDWQLGLVYDYAPTFAGLRPFSALGAPGELSRYLQQYRIKLWPERLLLRSTLSRSYQEDYMRALPYSSIEGLPATFAQSFIWSRGLNTSWRLTPNLTMTLGMGTEARIEEPYGQVNRSLNPDGYALWRDEVLRSISQLGSPLRYSQSTLLTYSLPTAQFRHLNWISGQASYNGSYQWHRGSLIAAGAEELPSRIINQSSLDLHLGMRLSSLYSKSKRLRSIERSFSSTSQQDTTQRRLSDRLGYTLMMLRDLQLNYRQTGQTLLPVFAPIVGSWGGQSPTLRGLAPGLLFALGLTDEHFIHEAQSKGWLTSSQAYTEPAVYTHTRTLETKATLRPLAGLYIYLNSLYSHTSRSEHLYMYREQPIQRNGELTMTTIGLRGFWEALSPENAYESRSSAALQAHISRLRASNAPQSEYLEAFRQSYEHRSAAASRSSASPIPSILSSLPNWRITYTTSQGQRLLGMKLRSLTLSHSYRGIYRVNNYLEQDGEGSSTYDISSVSLQESFFPLLGIELALQSGLSLSTQWRSQRALTFSPNALRLIESKSTELSIGLGYRLSDIRTLWGRASSKDGKNKGLTLRGEWVYKDNINLMRQLSLGNATATLGSLEHRLSLNAEYELSQMLSLKGFYQWSRIIPRVSHGSYPTRIRQYGLSLRLTLGS